jgi:hypothetical protein
MEHGHVRNDGSFAMAADLNISLSRSGFLCFTWVVPSWFERADVLEFIKKNKCTASGNLADMTGVFPLVCVDKEQA